MNVSNCYEIRVQGHLDRRWEDYLEPLKIELLKNGETRLYGQVADQAALHGLLDKIFNYGLTLLLVRMVEYDRDATTLSKE